MDTKHGVTSPREDLPEPVIRAALVEIGGREDLPLEQTRDRLELRLRGMTERERLRLVAEAMQSAAAPTPDVEVGTMTTPDGREVPCSYELIDEDYARRYDQARVVAHVRVGAWLVQRARRGMPAAPCRCQRRESHGRRPGHRRRTGASSSSSSADPGDEGEPAQGRPDLTATGGRP